MRNTTRRQILGIAMALVASCSADERSRASREATPPTNDLSAARMAVERNVIDYYRDMSARDWEAYGSHFWPGAMLTTVWQPPGEPKPYVVPTSIEDFLAQTHIGPDSQPIFEEKLIDQEIRIRGDIALVFARYEARFGSPDSVMTWTGTDAFTWLRHDGTWRITGLTYANDE